TGGGGDRGSVHRGEEDRRDRRRRRDRERAEEDVPGAQPQLEPCRARAEVGDGEYAAAEVVGAEESRRPACSLRGRLARRRGGEQREAEGPERLLAGRPRAIGPREQEREQDRDEDGRDRED